MRLPKTMHAVLLTSHGGYEALDYRTDVPVPQPRPGEVLIRVAAAGVNNTDINTRTGWYSKAVTAGSSAGGAQGFAGAEDRDASWSGIPLRFPRIQGADACGRIVAAGEGVPESLSSSRREPPNEDRPDRTSPLPRSPTWARPYRRASCAAS
jgi:NADPH:quinone reductase-like Zn-dependent oxidoreductase